MYLGAEQTLRDGFVGNDCPETKLTLSICPLIQVTDYRGSPVYVIWVRLKDAYPCE